MKTKLIPRAALLLHPAFLGALAVLLLNDYFLKETFHNWWTGKLSDVAGMLLLPLLVFVVTGWRASVSVVVSALAFGFMKSAAAQSAIDAYNSLAPIDFHRVVDYSDLLAWLVLPLSYHFIRRFRPAPVRAPVRFTVGQLVVVFGILCALSAWQFEDDDLAGLIEHPLENCCPSPIIATVGPGRIIVPSAFTPDGDGLHDFFFPVVDSGIVRLDTLWIIETWFTGDTVFFQTNLSADAQGWDGMVGDSIRTTSFIYRLHATASDGRDTVLFGRGCSLPCPSGQASLGRIAVRENCAFASQVDPTTGNLNFSIDSGEELECYD